MKIKRILSVLLAAALMISLAALPAGAAPGSFDDVSDPVTAVNADILRLMGVVSGTGGNMFDPAGTLTRAQFCTMTIRFLQREEEAQRYATRTIFSDVTSTHWARGYVNLAATVGEGENSVPLVSGVGNGMFMPDSQISLAEAVTILLRALGYSDQQVGAVWPQGYLDLAASIGLTAGLNAGAYDSISRAQAAQLFVNALKCKTPGGEVYYKSLGSTVPEAIVLAVNVETDDGSAGGAIRVAGGEKGSEAYLPANGEGNPVALQGKRGDMVLNDKGNIVTFIPDDSAANTITLSGNAQAVYVRGDDGRQYTISGNTPVYTAAGGESKTYSSCYNSLLSGTRITMYSRNGKIVAVYASVGATETTSDAVVVMNTATTATFHQLTGGASDFTIVKNRQPIRMADIKPYDVVTYDKLTNTLVVSDLRLACVYGDALPNTKTPQTVKVLDNEFAVLESAWNTCGDFKPGDSVVLLLTADGKVAGMAKPGSQVRSTAIGFVKGGSGIEIFLPNGLTRTLEGTLSNAGLDQQLVSVSATKTGISVSRLSSRAVPGDFDVTGMKLGSYTVSVGARVYEQVSGGAMVEVNRGDLGMDSIPAGQITGYQMNSSNIVEYIVLKDVTGNAYEYGMMVAVTSGEGEEAVTKWKLMNGDPFDFADTVGYSGRSGDMVGVVAGTPKNDGSGKTMAAIVQLTEVRNVRQSNFFESQGVPHITVNGRTYRIADDVECCRSLKGNRNDPKNWFDQETGSERLSAVRAYADSFTVYVDPVGNQVRVIAAN